MTEELVNLVVRQTNYDEEKAKERLLFWKNDYISVIKQMHNLIKVQVKLLFYGP